MNRLLFGDNLKPKRSGAESDETPSFAANAAVSFLPQWLRDMKIFPDANVDLAYLDPPLATLVAFTVRYNHSTNI